MSIGIVLASAALVIWCYLLTARGGFWRAAEREDRDPPLATTSSPAVVAIVPARDEAAFIGETVRSLLGQDYSGSFAIIVVADQSTDGTAAVAADAAAGAGKRDALTIRSGRSPPNGWTGKLWAMQQGLDHVASLKEPPRYLLFTDADVAYERDVLRR